MELNYKVLGEGKDLIILHGLFGSLDNWQTLAKYWADNYRVWLIDQRNHGRSPHSKDFSYQLMAEDLNNFIDEHKINSPIVLGHSMGGKTAMEFAVNNPNMLSKLIVVDIAPVKYQVHHYSIIDALKSVPLQSIEKRSEAEEILAKNISEFGVRQFLLKNLYRNNDGGYSWRFNLNIISDNILPISEYDIPIGKFEGKTLFVKGDNSDYILNSYKEIIVGKFPKARIETIKNAGHWIHAEQPQVFFDLVSDFMKD
jgi:pimeloyl-ACP methyl ester carboxylesterase